MEGEFTTAISDYELCSLLDHIWFYWNEHGNSGDVTIMITGNSKNGFKAILRHSPEPIQDYAKLHGE